MIKNNTFNNFFASVTPPNPNTVAYWADLGANSKGKIIKIYDSSLNQWVGVYDINDHDLISPFIGNNGNWFVDSRDTGVRASGNSPILKIGDITTIGSNEDASAYITPDGIENGLFVYKINISIPKGTQGASPEFGIGTVTTINSAENARIDMIKNGDTVYGGQKYLFNMYIPGGPKGDKGDTGDSAYEIAVIGGYSGAEAQWLESLKLHFQDLTQADITLLQKPAADKADELDSKLSDTTEFLRLADLAEEERGTNESERISNENARKQSETGREQAETLRVSEEDARTQSEDSRSASETARVATEASRVTAESGRVLAESARETSFSASKTAADEATANCNAALSSLSEMTANYMIVGIGKIAGDADPSASKFYGKDENIPLIFNHIRMGLVKSPAGNLYKFCEKLRVTKAIDGTTLAIDGTDGDVLLCTDCDIYLYLNNATVDGIEYEIMAIGLIPFSLYGISAIKLEPHAMTPHTTVNTKLTNDANSQAHSIYNASVIGSYSAPPSIFKTSFRINGGGCMNWGISSINSIIQGQNKNSSTTTNYPYAGLFHLYYELLCAMMFIEGKTMNHQDMDKFGGGNTSTYSANATNYNNLMQGNSMIKIIKSDSTALYYALMSNNLKTNSASSTNIYFLQALVGGSYYAIEEMLEPQRIIDNIAANGNQNNIGSSNIYTNMGATLIQDGSVNLVTGDGMNIGQRYYVVRNVPGFKGLSDGISTCVINCFIKMEFADDTVLGDNTSLTGAKAIYKLSYAMYRGWKLPFGIFSQLQGLHSIIHADASGLLSCSIKKTNDYKTLPVITGSSTLYGLETSELDMEKGMTEIASGLIAADNWGKKRNITYSMFHPITFGGALNTYDCAYNWRSYCYGQGVNGLPANGYKCVQSSAVGCLAINSVASVCSLYANHAVSAGSSSYAGGFSLHKLTM